MLVFNLLCFFFVCWECVTINLLNFKFFSPSDFELKQHFYYQCQSIRWKKKKKKRKNYTRSVHKQWIVENVNVSVFWSECSLWFHYIYKYLYAKIVYFPNCYSKSLFLWIIVIQLYFATLKIDSQFIIWQLTMMNSYRMNKILTARPSKL